MDGVIKTAVNLHPSWHDFDLVRAPSPPTCATLLLRVGGSTRRHSLARDAAGEGARGATAQARPRESRVRMQRACCGVRSNVCEARGHIGMLA